MNPTKREAIFARWKAANPTPVTELEYHSPFELLISVLLSAQATDISVNNATKGLYAEANSAAAMLALGEARVKHHIRTIGLFNTKAKNIIKTCQMLEERHGGEVPQDRDALEALPGVGRKTANVVLNTAFRQIAMAVDTHIFRVSNRTGIAPGKDVLVVEKKLLKFVPTEYLLDAHHWLILHGRYVCVARTPKCSECDIEDLCEYKQKGASKKAGKKKASQKKVGKKKVSARRVSPKKVDQKQTSATKIGTKQASTKKVSAKKANTKQVSTKKSSTKQASTKQASTKQVSTKKSSTEKSAKPKIGKKTAQKK